MGKRADSMISKLDHAARLTDEIAKLQLEAEQELAKLEARSARDQQRREKRTERLRGAR
ncbi:MAG: hypothetical protein ABR548_01515 [Actinomycetota bacterium]